jgi:hypothetical protein
LVLLFLLLPSSSLLLFQAFAELKWPVRFDVVKGGAEWPKDVMEEEILVWFQSACDEALQYHLSPPKNHLGPN